MRGKPTHKLQRKMVQFKFKDIAEMRQFLYTLLELSNENGVVPLYMRHADTKRVGLVLTKLEETLD